MTRALLFVACIACSARVTPTDPIERAQPIENTALAPEPPATESSVPPAGETTPGPSIYDLPIRLVAANGESIGLDVARGKPVLVSMFYASCTVACPLLISEVQQVLAELPADHDVQVLLVSFDAARDTPEKLTMLARERKLDERFTLAAASDADARALAAVLRAKYRKLANGEFAHSSTFVALDREGREIARADALGQRGPLVRALSAR